jgi:hypothetical protein
MSPASISRPRDRCLLELTVGTTFTCGRHDALEEVSVRESPFCSADRTRQPPIVGSTQPTGVAAPGTEGEPTRAPSLEPRSSSSTRRLRPRAQEGAPLADVQLRLLFRSGPCSLQYFSPTYQRALIEAHLARHMCDRAGPRPATSCSTVRSGERRAGVALSRPAAVDRNPSRRR